MSQLSIDLSIESLDDPSPLLLSRLLMEGETLEGTPKPSGTLHATAVECIHRTDTTVYRAKAVLMEGADPIHVILKTNILHPEREEGLLDEARVYATDAKLLQGHAIPYFYGAFQGEVAEDPMTCLVFEDCGKPLGIFFHQIDGELALEIMQRVLIFHDIGLRHNDLTEENIVINSEGRTFLIDLEYTEPHACKRKDDVLVGSKQPQKHEFGCSEVWEIARLMGLWTKSFVVLWGSCVPRSVIKTIAPESLITMAPQWLRETEEQREKLLDHARRVADEQRRF